MATNCPKKNPAVAIWRISVCSAIRGDTYFGGGPLPARWQEPLQRPKPRLRSSKRPIGKGHRELVRRAVHRDDADFDPRRQRRLDRRNVIPSLAVGAN